MKVENPFPAVTAIDAQQPRQAPLPVGERNLRQRKSARGDGTARLERGNGKAATFSIQLNQQLSAMQSAEGYLGELSDRLNQLKLSLGRELAGGQGSGRKQLEQPLQQAADLLAQRSERSAGNLDANLELHLHEPARTRFSIDGLQTLDQARDGGRETLLFSTGRAQGEPGVVVLDEALSDQQLLRSFNQGLAAAGIRAEVGEDGQLSFSMAESEWRQQGGQLSVQGEGKRFAKERAGRAQVREQSLLELPESLAGSDQRDMRRMLDQVINALDRIGTLREQLRQRQSEIREFLARQADSDEQQWAQDYASSVFNLVRSSGSSYSAVTQTVVAQANLSRFAVVSLLS
ncbi:hypothetical protein [Pseudomonas citronellolis]|uniref:hypothetical protein n=1 Tax=Pseudomonas citronellolis TaxID=53408 RepID=UPI0023E42ACB|nr:hypothetical protein [Pseudomonas citronellolis]MDF3933821.1 hypothetical protein [Pseudomonas citronellolis]